MSLAYFVLITKLKLLPKIRPQVYDRIYIDRCILSFYSQTTHCKNQTNEHQLLLLIKMSKTMIKLIKMERQRLDSNPVS